MAIVHSSADITQSAEAEAARAWWSQIPSYLLAAARHGELNVLVGAGISMDVELPSWEAMLRAVAGSLPAAKRDAVRAFVEDGHLLDAAELLREYFNAQELCHALRDVLGRTRQPGPLHRAVWRLGARAVLTTNFDHLLEHAYAREYHKAPLVRCGLDVEPPDYLRSEDVLFKLHGDLEHPEALVLSSNDYLDAARAMPLSRIASAFAHRPTLALGYSLRDLDIELLLSQLNMTARGLAQPLYLVLPEQPQRELDRLKRKKSVVVIQYPRCYSHRDALLPFLDRLALERQKQRCVTQQSPASVALAHHSEREMQKALLELRRDLEQLVTSSSVSVKRASAAKPRRDSSATVVTKAATALRTLQHAQAVLTSAGERNQPALWSTCRASLAESLESAPPKQLIAKLEKRSDLTLPLGPNLYTLLVQIMLRNAQAGGGAAGRPIELTAAYDDDKHQLVTSVTDHGAGLTGVFTKDERGRSNELFLLMSVVEECGGELLVRHKPRRGAVIAMCLPVDTSVQRTNGAHAARPRRTDEEAEIVIIDDNRSLGILTGQNLEAEGYSVECFDDPQLAVDTLLRRKTAPALIISDIVMPKHDGNAVAALVRTRFPTVRFVFVSGYYINPAPGRERDTFMMKPVDPQRLLECAKQATGRG